MLRQLKHVMPEEKIQFFENEKIERANTFKAKIAGGIFIVALFGAWQTCHHSAPAASTEVGPTATRGACR
jgi:hypothetical protein